MKHKIVKLVVVVAMVAAIAACNSTSGPGPATPNCKPATPDAQIPLPLAPAANRVDLGVPAFSDPTDIDNPLFPIGQVTQLLQLGIVDGQVFRAEATLLPERKRIALDGSTVDALVSQYVAYLDGRIAEVALDFYAQDDAGAVWYLGEDVFNYEDGVIADYNGTWLACKDGPACMIMPADPRVGNVYRPENVYGIVFEEVVVQSIGQTVNGPRGPVPGAITVRELHQDGGMEDKTFAPGYGEFFTGSSGSFETAALAVPTDALPGSLPSELEAITNGLGEIFLAVRSEDWPAASTALGPVTTAWQTYGAGAVPPLLESAMNNAVDALATAIAAQNTKEAGQAACDAARAALDLQMQFLPLTNIDLARLDVWARQLQVDAAVGEHIGVLSDVVILDHIWDRVKHTVAKPTAAALQAQIATARRAAEHADFASAATTAVRLRRMLAEAS